MKVFINPGHSPDGLPDPGACGNGLRECDVALNIGNLLAKYLGNVGVETKVLQSDTPSNTFDEICEPANHWKADYFVSIHCNSFNESASGTETYCYSYISEGHYLAEAIHKQITKTFPELKDRGVKEACFSVLRKTKMPAVLIETAFISNEGDAYLLKACQDDFARAIARGITDYLLAK